MFDWQELLDWQLYSFGGNPATVIEVHNGSMASVEYTANSIATCNLGDSVQHWHCTDEESEEFAKNFKDGGVSFCFIGGDPSNTMKHLRAWYDKVHYNSLMAGNNIHLPEVRPALDAFCAEKKVPWKTHGKSCWSINHCHRMGQ